MKMKVTQLCPTLYNPMDYTSGLPKWLSCRKILTAAQETQEMWDRSLGQEDPLEEEMASHSNIFAWKIPWTEEPGGL